MPPLSSYKLSNVVKCQCANIYFPLLLLSMAQNWRIPHAPGACVRSSDRSYAMLQRNENRG